MIINSKKFKLAVVLVSGLSFFVYVQANNQSNKTSKILYAANGFHVVDGDTLRFGKDRIRLLGIDAPESKQICEFASGKKYKCGVESSKALKALVNSSTYCKVVSKDRYQRYVAVCYNGNLDLNAEMIKQGWAVAYVRYSKAYVSQEIYAKNNKLGIWQGNFQQPSDYRKTKNNKN